MSGLATTAAIAVSLAAIVRLAATDPKRRRSFGLEPYPGRRRAGLAAVAVLVPGAVLLFAGTGAGFVVWLGACSVAGWAVAAVSPVQTARAAGWLAAVTRAPRLWLRTALARTHAGGQMAEALRSLLLPTRPLVADGAAAARIAELEQRVAYLEAALAAARSGREPDLRVARLSDFQGARARGGD